MGHILLGSLPRTRQWAEVAALLGVGAGPAQVANATLRAAERALRHVYHGDGLVETTWLLMQLPQAARADDFTAALRRCGVPADAPPGLMALVGGVTDAIDARLANNVGRTDLGEMAQMAAAETLTAVLGARTQDLFGTTPAHVQDALGQLHTATQFGRLARHFFARFTFKVLDYFLSRVLADHAGDGRRFTTLAQQLAFSAALETHCREAALIVERFSGEWLAKTRWAAGDVTRRAAAQYTHGAIQKLVAELKEGARSDGD